MPTLPTSLALAVLLLAPGAAGAEAAAPARAQVPEQYRWRLEDLYPSDQAWAQAKDAFGPKIEALERRRGHLGDGPRAIADALAQMGSLQNELQRLLVYAQGRNDEDTREAGPRAMRAEAEALGVRLSTATAWIRPGLLALPAAKAKAALGEPRLKDWSFYLRDLLRWKPHTLSAEEERLVSMAGELAQAPATTFEVLVDADLPYPTVQLSTGEALRLDPTGFEKARAAPDRADRQKAFQAYFQAVKGYERTLGTTLYATLRAHDYQARAHRFGSTLEAALFDGDIPTDLYRQLVKDVNANLGTLHRYLALRRRMLGLDKLGYPDLYPPLVKGIDRSYPIEQAQAMTLAAVAPLGPDYQAKLRHGFESRWTDFLPSTGKRSGAYSTEGVYGVHPFQLLNYNGRWEDLLVLAHESGHSMHTLLSYEKQPFPTAEYPVFVAEVASTLDENLLLRKAAAEAKDDDERLFYLGARVERMRGVLFRQTLFAEFELQVHQAAERGEALTGERMSELYLALLRRYYGHDQGVCEVDALYGVEWAEVPHFYYDYYVYQYATSVVASSALARAILEDQVRGSTAARDRTLAMLAAGGSDHPVELLRRAGVDMTTSAPFQAAMADLNDVMDQMDAILARQAAR